MSQQKKLEKVLDLLLSEDSERAAELLHQIIVEKARTIYESIIDEEDDADDEVADDDVVGGDPDEDFTDEIASDKDEVSADEQNDGEADSDDEFGDADDGDDEMGEGDVEDRVEDLESQLADLRAEFDALMGEEMNEPEHADMGDEFGDDMGDDGVEPVADSGTDMPDFGGNGEEKVVGEVVATMYEKKKAAKLDKAPQAKDKKKDKKVDEETKFLNKVSDTGQRGTAKLAGTGKDSQLGAEEDTSLFTRAPNKPSYGGSPVKFGSGTGGEYGKYNGESAKDSTPSNNVNVKGKNSSIKADTTAKYTGGAAAGEGNNKSPLTKKPS